MEFPNQSDHDLIKFCLEGPPERILAGSSEGNLIVRISTDRVIKFGAGLSEDEANNQRVAYHLVDHSIVHIPFVECFFTDNHGRGYIVMEYIEGHVIDPLEDPERIAKVAQVLDYFGTFTADNPGSLSGGICRGLLWPDSDDLSFTDKCQMEAWFNSRLFPGEGSVSFDSCDLVPCHLDVAPRNIIWQKDGRICLIDWTSAGFYPRLFEFWAQWNIEGMEGSFNSLLLQSMRPLEDHESVQKWPICRVWHNTQKYVFGQKTTDTEQKHDVKPVPGPPVPPFLSTDIGNSIESQEPNCQSSDSSNTSSIISKIIHNVQYSIRNRPWIVLAALGGLALVTPLRRHLHRRAVGL